MFYLKKTNYNIGFISIYFIPLRHRGKLEHRDGKCMHL